MCKPAALSRQLIRASWPAGQWRKARSYLGLPNIHAAPGVCIAVSQYPCGSGRDANWNDAQTAQKSTL